MRAARLCGCVWSGRWVCVVCLGSTDFDALVKATDLNGHLKIVFMASDLMTEVGSVDLPDVAFVSASFADYSNIFNVEFS